MAESIDYNGFFCNAIDKIKTEGRYRIFNTMDYGETNFPVSKHSKLNKNVVIWCTNNYLGMAQNASVKQAAMEACNKYGVGSGGTRNIGGTHASIVALENLTSELHKKESSLIFTSGYVANQAALSTIPKLLPNCVILSDQFNHASMIHGIVDSKCEKIIFNHNDSDHLERILAAMPLTKPKLIVFESVYSMSGSVSPIAKFAELAKKYNALTYIDEVHAVGLYGTTGAGMVEELGLTGKIDIIQGNFAKGYGVIGGYISANSAIIDAVRCHASSFIFTTTLPPSITAAIMASVEYLMQNPHIRKLHKDKVAKVKDGFVKHNIPHLSNNTHIVPLMICDPFICQQFADDLLNQFNIYVQSINYPTVPKGTERLRITPTPMHDDKMIEDLISACAQLKDKYNLKR